jgi:BA14K-like protein
MTAIKILSAAAALATMMAPPVFGQAAIGEPGAFAFYHPNADVLNAGRPTPRQSAGAIPPLPFGSAGAYASVERGIGAASCAQRYRSYDPESGTFLGHDGRRHPCQ